VLIDRRQYNLSPGWAINLCANSLWNISTAHLQINQTKHYCYDTRLDKQRKTMRKLIVESCTWKMVGEVEAWKQMEMKSVKKAPIYIRFNKKRMKRCKGFYKGLPTGRLDCLEGWRKEVNTGQQCRKEREESFKQSVRCLVATELLPDKEDLLHTHRNMADLSWGHLQPSPETCLLED